MYRTHIIKDFRVHKYDNAQIAEIYQWIKLHAQHTPNSDVLYNSYYITHNQKLMFDMLYTKAEQKNAETRLRNSLDLVDPSGQYTIWFPDDVGVQLEMFTESEMGPQVVQEDPPLPITWIP